MSSPPPRGWSRLQEAMHAELRAFRRSDLRHCATRVTTLLGHHLIEELPITWHEADAEDERQRQLLASQKLALLNRMAGKDKAPCKVAHRLYIGPIGAARNLKALRKAGITHILNATAVVPCFFRERPVGAFSYLHVPIFDEASTELLPHLEEANAFVAAGRRAGGVLVHCYAGQSRSAAFVIAHLVAHEGADLLTAWSTVRKARPCAAPNAGFMKQLALYARSLGRDSGPLPLDDEE